jgi:hypothetical protein
MHPDPALACHRRVAAVGLLAARKRKNRKGARGEIPVMHMLYFTRHIQAHSDYQLAVPTFATLFSMVKAVILSEGSGFLGPGLLLLMTVVLLTPELRRAAFGDRRVRLWWAMELLWGGIFVYLPMVRPAASPAANRNSNDPARPQHQHLPPASPINQLTN